MDDIRHNPLCPEKEVGFMQELQDRLPSSPPQIPDRVRSMLMDNRASAEAPPLNPAYQPEMASSPRQADRRRSSTTSVWMSDEMDVDYMHGDIQEDDLGGAPMMSVANPEAAISSNPLICKTTRTVTTRREEEVREVTTELYAIDHDPREYHYQLAKVRVRHAAFGAKERVAYTKLFVIFCELFAPLRVLSDRKPSAPWLCILILTVSAMNFTALISEYGARNGDSLAPDYYLTWFLPRFVSGDHRTIPDSMLDRWGAASRCSIMQRGNLWRVFTTPWIHVSTNHFGTNMISVALWGTDTERHIGTARFALVTTLGQAGATLLSLAALPGTERICGLGGVSVACMLRTFLDGVFHLHRRTTRRVGGAVLICGYMLYALFTEISNRITMVVGALIPATVAVYLVHNYFASEVVDALIPAIGLSLVLLFALACIASTLALPACT